MISSSDQTELQLMLGKWLAKVREDRGLSQEALALQIGKNQSDIAKIELGQKKALVTDLFKWSLALNISFEEIMEGLKPLYDQLEVRKTLWDNSQNV